MKLRLLIISLLLLTPYAFSQTELEKLWFSSQFFSSNLLIQKMQENQNEINEKYSYSEYLPTFTFSVEDSFSDAYSNITAFPYSTEGSLSSTLKVPGGGYLSSAISYKMNRYIMNSRKTIDSDNLGYDQIPGFSISYMQSLNPFYLHGVKDPVIESYKKQTELGKLTFYSEEYSLKTQIASDYIQLRRYTRLAGNASKEIELLEYIINYLIENKELGNSSYSDLWEYQNKSLEYNGKLLEYIEEKERLHNELEILCGKFDFNDTEKELPAYTENIPEFDFIIKQMEIQNYNLKLQNVIDGQNYAPKLGLTGSASYNFNAYDKDNLFGAWSEKGTVYWTIGISLELSPENIAILKRNKLLYEENLDIYKEQKDLYLKNKKTTIEMYEKSIEHYELLLHDAEMSCEHKAEYYEAMKIQKERGVISELELRQSQLIFDESESIVNNYKDMIWYYKWLRNMIVD